MENSKNIIESVAKLIGATGSALTSYTLVCWITGMKPFWESRQAKDDRRIFSFSIGKKYAEVPRRSEGGEAE